MQPRFLQMPLAAIGQYAGGIDGIIGPKTRAAIAQIEAAAAGRYQFRAATSTEGRRRIAALQVALDDLGHEPGSVDGWYGHNTEEALNAFLYHRVHKKAEVIDRAPVPAPVPDPVPASAPDPVPPPAMPSASIPHRTKVAEVYGRPGDQIRSRLVTVELPFKLRIDWNLRQRTNKITVHRDCAAPLRKALNEVRAHYGDDGMRDLGLDRYAGAYNHRKIRGGSSWSMHAYGCAIDFYAAPNGLRTRCPDALFCKPQYKAFLDIMERNEWLPAIRLWGADAMHFQRARH